MSQIIAVVPVGTDPEAAAIARLLTEAGIRVHVPHCEGKPVHAGNAYRADSIIPPIPGDGSQVLRVECDGPAFAGVDPSRIVVIDHHRPGDSGYGRPPEEFMSASSIGQVVAELARLGRLPVRPYPECYDHGWILGRPDTWAGPPRDEDGAVIDPSPLGYFAQAHTGEWCVTTGDGYDSVRIPADIVLAAAADHCLEAAYRGRCPGVDPDALMRWRAESRAEFQKRPVEAVLADIEAARERLREAMTPIHTRDHDWSRSVCDGCARDFDYADLRGESIPELPEAAAHEGIPFIADQVDRDGRRKVVLQAAPPELVSRFLAGEIVPGLVDMYGDPARGLAGGYKK
jgi:hypothetical protein